MLSNNNKILIEKDESKITPTLQYNIQRSNSRLLTFLNLPNNADLKIIETKIESITKEITKKESEIQTIENTIEVFNELIAAQEADIIDINTNLLPNSKKEIEKLNSLIPQEENEISKIKSNIEFIASKTSFEKAKSFRENLESKQNKTNTEILQLKDIQNVINNLEETLKKHEVPLIALEKKLLENKKSLKKFKNNLKAMPKTCDELRNIEIPNNQTKISQQITKLNNAKLQLEDLQLYLLKLEIMRKKLNLDKQLIADAEFVKITDNQKETLKKRFSDAPLHSLISAYKESYRLENTIYFQDFDSSIKEIENANEKLAGDDTFKESIMSVLKEYKQQLDTHRAMLKNIAQELRLLADQTAKKLSGEIKAALEKLITAFTKQIQPYANNLKIPDGKHNNLIWHSKKTLQAVFAWTSNLIFNHAIKVADFFNETNAKFDLVKMEKDNLALAPLKPNLDLEEILNATSNLQNEHESSQEELKKFHDESKLTLVKQERRTAINQQYTIVLDNYLIYRDEKYKIKDFFYNKDKIARHDFIEKIKIALWEYKSLDCDDDNFNALVKNGISKFKNGFFSNKKDPTKNLQDILILLNRDTQGVPTGQDNSLRISEFIKTAEVKERKTTILEKYSAALDQFEFFVNKYHKVKDTFFGKEKAKRQNYMKKLKTQLKDYETSTATTETTETVVKTVKEGLDTFKDYPISGKHDPMKNLQRILDLLLQDILNPLEHTYLRISGYLDKEHAPIPLDSDLPPAIALRSG